jgi:glutaminyl-peptide cyclotransferase
LFSKKPLFEAGHECDNGKPHMKISGTRYWHTLALLLAAPASLLPAQVSQKASTQRPREYTFKIVHTFPHDPAAYTQGLAYRDGFLYEGTGRNGTSSLRKVRLETGEVLQRRELPQEYFGEGIALIGNEVVQLTWKSQVGFVYDVSDFRLLRQFSYTGEGWGLATNGREVFMSDGTAEIRVLDIDTLQEKRRFTVRDDGIQVRELNELEFVEGELFANVWQTDRIARISPETGNVVGWIDLSGILSQIYRRERDSVLNGIAYDAKEKRLFVTGKLWPSIFEIKVVPKVTTPANSR